jgi:hypothetical protein
VTSEKRNPIVEELLAMAFPRKHLLMLGFCSIIVGLALSFIPDNEAAASRKTIVLNSPLDSSSNITEKIDVSDINAKADNPSTPIHNIQKSTAVATPTDAMTSNTNKGSRSSGLSFDSIKVKKGDTLAGIFKRKKISPTTLHHLVRADKNSALLKKIKPGQTIDLGFNNERTFQKLTYHISNIQKLDIDVLDDNKFHTELITREYDVRIAQAQGIIRDSLFLAGQESGLSDRIIMELANIFGWDVDFVLDIRRNDSFQVIYEEYFLDGEKVKDGNILAAEFFNRGKSFHAISFYDKSWVAPFGNRRVKGYFPPRRRLSQDITSFIASSCQGIHRVHLFT